MVDYRSRRRRTRLAIPARFKDIFLLERILKYALFGLIGLVVLVPVLFLWYSRDLPTPGKLVISKYSDATRIYDRKGELLYSVYENENRTYVKLAEIASVLPKATIAIEDKDFYKNNGFSPAAYLRVFRNALLGKGLAGGSTITQQLVKNVLLSSERSLPRKIKELILAIQVDQKYSKDQILEMYLNNIPYGGSTIGVEAAAESYFGKKAKELDLAESAFLAGLPQSPSIYSPFTGNKYYINRTDAVLKQMVSEKYITTKEKDAALKKIQQYTFSQRATQIKAPHFVMDVRDKLAKQFGEEAVAKGGLQVTTSLDYAIQEKAEEIVKEEIDKLKGFNARNGAAMITDPKTGEILAMVGSKDYFDIENDGNFNVALAPNRQPGSSLKPIIYARAFEKGYTPATLLMDVKTEFYSGDQNEKPYVPVNYDGKFRGPVQVRFALGNSLNIPAVKMLAQVGIRDAMQKGYDMGIKHWEPTSENLRNVGWSLVLGGKETSLDEIVTAYGVFANKGQRQDHVAILKVTDNKGRKLFEHKKQQGEQVLSPEVAFLISHILLDNVARTETFGPNSYLNISGRTVAVKTGTTDEKRDNWTIGYTPSFVVGVWVGNNDNTPMNPKIASGVTGASPIWNKLMTLVLKGKPAEQFEQPSSVTAMQIDALGGGLPVAVQPSRSEYFIKGTEPTNKSSIYQRDFLVFKENDPISKDGKNRWQEGIDAWIESSHKDDSKYHAPDDVKNPRQDSPTATPAPAGVTDTPTPTPTLTPSPTP